MDSFEWNKIIGAVLATALFIMVVKIADESLFPTPKLAKQAYQVPGVTETAAPSGESAAAAPAEEAVPDFATVIPAADQAHGQQIAQRCAQCHDWTKGGPNKIGPNLYGIINRARGTHEGFSYSAAMKGKGGSWSYADIFQYTKQPAVFIPGNKMAFAGLPKAQDRLDLIAYMRTWADTPPALPPPAPAASKPAAPASAAQEKPKPK